MTAPISKILPIAQPIQENSSTSQSGGAFKQVVKSEINELREGEKKVTEALQGKSNEDFYTAFAELQTNLETTQNLVSKMTSMAKEIAQMPA